MDVPLGRETGCLGQDFAADTEQQANAALIAAAPDLLAVLKLALDIIENDDGCAHGLEPIRAAIAKAQP